MTTVDEILSEAQDTLTVQRVYGEPVTHNGVTIIPAAAVRGGGGGGAGEPGEGAPGGSGGGFGMSARPVGAYQIKGEQVEWVPAADTTRVILLAELMSIVALLVLRSIVKIRRRSS
ncbi:MAG: sporulation protein [Acidimicrobiia bacterium]|nr:sporulation protein [Acidimicrobiia bacterium]